MTRVHFEMIAQVILTAERAGAISNKRVLGMMFADALQRTNPEFNRAKFLATIGVGGDNPA